MKSMRRWRATYYDDTSIDYDAVFEEAWASASRAKATISHIVSFMGLETDSLADGDTANIRICPDVKKIETIDNLRPYTLMANAVS
jgi:hypothetical protein